jgi:hypothetical protein
MTEQEMPDSGDDLWRAILAELREILTKVLKCRLHFADPEEVSELAVIQVDHHHKPCQEELERLLAKRPSNWDQYKDWLQQQAQPYVQLVVREKKVVAYVDDCDRVAEYLDVKTSEARRLEIRGFYWNAYRKWVAKKLFAMFRDRDRDLSPDAPRLQEAQHWVEDQVFAEEPFKKTCVAYKPSRGKTFAGFLEFQLIRRCLDARDKFASESEKLVLQAASGDEEAPSECPGQRLQRCLSAFKDPEMRAVVELRYRAYVEPEFMAPWTLARAGKVASRGQLESEFDADQQTLRKLQEEEIPEREGDRREAYHHREIKHVDVELQGWPRKQINELAACHNTTIEKLQFEMDQANTTPARKCELEFQIACIRYNKALSRLLEARDLLARYRRARYPWVRTQEEIAKLLGMSQAKVSRLLEDALTAMKSWLLLNPPPANTTKKAE